MDKEVKSELTEIKSHLAAVVASVRTLQQLAKVHDDDILALAATVKAQAHVHPAP